MKSLIKRLVPRQVRSQIKSSDLYFKIANNFESKRLAKTSKRLDLCAGEVANYFFHSGISQQYPLRNKVCMELGSGWVLSHSLCFYLLGAKKVYATDVEKLLYPENISLAVRESVGYIVLDSLGGFEEYDLVRERLDKLLSISRFSMENLKELGIEYIAPIDLARRPLGDAVDFVFSKSVLEHVPVSDIRPLLVNLVTDLSPEGMMFHLIHLEDHKYLKDKPFEFLAESPETFTKEIQTARGNRIRRSQWQQIFSSIEHLDYEFVFEWSRNDKELPERIDLSIKYLDEQDLRVTHLGVWGRKKYQ